MCVLYGNAKPETIIERGDTMKHACFLFLAFLFFSCSVTKEEAIKALQDGDVGTVKKYLITARSPDEAVNQLGYNFLHLAILGKNRAMAETILSGGIGIESATKAGFTPLMLALQNKDPEMTRFLLESGADPNAVNNKDRRKTALHYAAINGPVENVKMLVDKGAKVDALDGIRANAVNWAAWIGPFDCVKFLVEAGSDLHIVDTNGDTPLSSSKSNPDKRIYEYLRSADASR